MAGQAESGRKKSGSLVMKVAEALRERIVDGGLRPGDKIPTEVALVEEFGVSRTVIREAVARLRTNGLVEARQGAGVFVLEPPAEQPAGNFLTINGGLVSGVLEVLELRRAVEIEAAGLAAKRRTPAQEGRIVECLQAQLLLAEAGEPTVEADFDFHVSIADATNNPRFREFMTLIVSSLKPRITFDPPEGMASPLTDRLEAVREHHAIVDAILDGDDHAARAAMSQHMDRSIARYRKLLRAAARS